MNAKPKARQRAVSILGLATATMTRTAPRSKKTQESWWEQDKALLSKHLALYGNGSMIRGWRSELDPDGNLQVTYAEFCKFAKKSAYVGDAVALVGRDGDFAHLSLSEVSPRKGQVISDFKQWIKEHFQADRTSFPGDYPHQRFFAACEHVGAGKVTQRMFFQALRREGCPMSNEDLMLIYDCLDFAEVGFFRQDDTIFLEEDSRVRDAAALRATTSQMRMWKQRMAQEYLESKTGHAKDNAGQVMSAAHRLAPRPWHAQTFENLPHVMCKRRYERTMERHRRMRDARLAFIDHYRTLYGSAIRLLRRGLDPNATFAVEPVRLRKYCRQKNLDLSPFDLWNSLDMDGDGVISLEELSMQDAILLAHFLKWARETTGSAVGIWDSPEGAMLRKAQQEKGAWVSHKNMQSKVFMELLSLLGWPLASDNSVQLRLTSALDYHGSDLMMRSDLEWLDKWRPPEWLAAAPDKEAWLSLKKALNQKYGHLLLAWRALLCSKDDSAILSWRDFSLGCIKLGFEGNVAGAWRFLDDDVSGTITIHEFDAPTAALLIDFKDWCDMSFGSVKHCFKALDGERNGSIKFTELKRVCTKFKFQGDVRKLFHCLCSDQWTAMTRRTLMLEEIVFLDKWEVPPTDEQLDGRYVLDERKNMLRKQYQKRCSKLTKAVTAMMQPNPQTGQGPRAESGGDGEDEEEDDDEDSMEEEEEEEEEQEGEEEDEDLDDEEDVYDYELLEVVEEEADKWRLGEHRHKDADEEDAEKWRSGKGRGSMQDPLPNATGNASRPVSRQQEVPAVCALLPTISRSTTPATAGSAGQPDAVSCVTAPFPFFADGGAQPRIFGSCGRHRCSGGTNASGAFGGLGPLGSSPLSRPQSEGTLRPGGVGSRQSCESASGNPALQQAPTQVSVPVGEREWPLPARPPAPSPDGAGGCRTSSVSILRSRKPIAAACPSSACERGSSAPVQQRSGAACCGGVGGSNICHHGGESNYPVAGGRAGVGIAQRDGLLSQGSLLSTSGGNLSNFSGSRRLSAGLLKGASQTALQWLHYLDMIDLHHQQEQSLHESSSSVVVDSVWSAAGGGGGHHQQNTMNLSGMSVFSSGTQVSQCQSQRKRSPYGCLPFELRKRRPAKRSTLPKRVGVLTCSRRTA